MNYLKLEKRPIPANIKKDPDYKEGLKVEQEHTKNKKIVKQLAADHEKEFKGKHQHYYQELKKMENRLKKADIASELETLSKVEQLKKKKQLKIKEAFDQGFMKRAVERGMTAGEAIELINNLNK